MLHISKDYMTFNNYYYRNRYLKYGTWTHIQLVCRRAEYGFNTAVSVAIGCWFSCVVMSLNCFSADDAAAVVADGPTAYLGGNEEQSVHPRR